jgi:MinD-like ATPase involved in chromosome partitioning or flagellar assembly
MFVTTFYSFRGGVGRTMALVNIGTWLARHGRRVLLVDFDLESPGISHYALTEASPDKKGVIDYIYEMSEGTAPPSLEDYYFEAFKDRSGGSLYVMPAGRASTHVSRFEKLNLGALYKSGDGYLILENLKCLWRDQITPDYVLIDSRTGYNEVAGICTRQLPDAVVAAFIPSPQNLTGLKEVVSQIRLQNKEPWRAPIPVYFLASSVPSLDDEDGEIKDAIDRSKQILEFDELLGCVYYIPSPSHLQQAVFTLTKDNSRLAKNFAEVARALAFRNPADPEGAEAFLDRLLNRDMQFTRSIAPMELEDKLQGIRRLHSGNPQVLFRLARLRMRQGQTDAAIEVLDAVLECDKNATEPRLLRATLRAQGSSRDGAVDDLRFLLARTDLDVLQVSRALNTLATVSPNSLSHLGQFAAFSALNVDGRASLTLEIAHVHPLGIEALSTDLQALATQTFSSDARRKQVLNAVALNFIREGKFHDAIEIIGFRPTRSSTQQDIFNYAMADWGLSNEPPKELFESLIAAAGDLKDAPANHLQCLAMANAVLNRKDEALTLLAAAKQKALRLRGPEFSCWTYQQVAAPQFARHIDAMQKALIDGDMTPPVITRTLATAE